MIKKYTGIIFVALLFLLFFNGNKVCAMYDMNYSPVVTNERMDSAFMQEEDPVSFRNARFMNDPLTEDFTVWSADGSIYVRSNKAVDMYVYTITGQLSKRLHISAGETGIQMTKGLYIVRIENVARKVVVR